MWNSKSSLRAQQQKIDSISNNISNINTTAYKKSAVNFEDLVYESLERKGYPISKKGKEEHTLQNGTGIKTADPVRNFAQGNLLETNMKTDFAVEGSGYFEINLSSGQKAYTRDGSFKVDLNGQLVDKNGNPISVVDDNGKEVDLIKLDSKLTNENIKLNRDGEIYAVGNNLNQKLGKVKLIKFVGDDSLQAIGGNNFIAKEDAEIVEAKDSIVFQGFLEQSNVNFQDEMVEMMLTQRAFQMSSSSLKTADEMWGMVNNLRR
jgi:flagellar basal-body rod protein FlgG